MTGSRRFARTSAVAALLFAAIAAAAAPLAQAWEESPALYRGTRALGFGGAFTAVADDEQAIFFNPAGLAGIRDTRFKLVSGDVEGSLDAANTILGVVTGTSALMTAFTSSNPFDAFGNLMGQNIYARAQVSSTFVMPNFGLAIIGDQSFGLLPRNIAYPNFDALFMTTYGVQAGLGLKIFRSKKRAFELRAGLAGKLLWRRGGFRTIPTLDLLQISTLGVPGFFGQQFGGFGIGLGIDAGIQAVKTFKGGWSVMAGTALKDIANTGFGPGIQPLTQDWSVGVAGSWDLGGMKATLAYDLQRILDDIDPRKKHHLGLEFNLPIVTLYGGLHDANLTYGFAVDLWLLRLTAIYYVEEAGVFVGQNPMGRYLAKIEAKFAF